MTKPAPIVTCARCGGTLYPGLHYCFGSYHERKIARARLECKVELAMEKRQAGQQRERGDA